MDELKRLAYLKAMGIESWVFQSSKLFPDSVEAFVNTSEGAPEEAVLESSKNHTINEGVLPSAELKQGVDEAREGSRSFSGSGKIPSSDSTIDIKNNGDSGASINAENEVPVFAFASFSASNNMLILLELADPDSPGLSSSEIALLESILFAIKKKPVDGPAYDKEIFSWPSLVGAHQDKGRQAAREAVKSYVNGKVYRNRIRNILILGNKALENMDAFLLEGEAVQLTATFSLSEMLQNPGLKPVVWKNIKKLINM